MVDAGRPEENKIHTDIGSIKIADEVVAVIAGLAATEVPGVAGMSGGIAGGIVECLAGKTWLKELKWKWEKRNRC